MSQESGRPLGQPNKRSPLESDVSVALFVPCDFATVTNDQKLFVSGANIDRMLFRELPGAIGQLYLAVLVKVPWHLTGEQHTLRIRLLNSDRQPVGPDPLVEAQAEVGRPPGSRAGEEFGVPFAVSLIGIEIGSEVSAFFHLELDGSLAAVYPFQFRLAPPGSFLPGQLPGGPPLAR